jgi:hypothetical protein
MAKKNKMQEDTQAATKDGWGPELERLYGIRDPAQVFAFLARHPFLVGLLKDVQPRIREHFPGSRASLEVGKGTLGTGDEELVVSVATKLNPVDAFKQRQQFDAWGRASLVHAMGKLHLRMEFRKAEDTAPWENPTAEALDSLLTLPPNWDSYGARPVDHGCAAYALEVLRSIMGDNTPPPQVVPTSVGGVQLEWHERGIDVEIEVRKPDCGHVLYENLKTGAEWEGEIPADLTQVTEFMADLSR